MFLMQLWTLIPNLASDFGSNVPGTHGAWNKKSLNLGFFYFFLSNLNEIWCHVWTWWETHGPKFSGWGTTQGLVHGTLKTPNLANFLKIPQNGPKWSTSNGCNLGTSRSKYSIFCTLQEETKLSTCVEFEYLEPFGDWTMELGTCPKFEKVPSGQMLLCPNRKS